MMVSIHQPAYLPWLGYFARIAASDVHVVLDHVQFEKNSFINRNRVRAAQGACWLTVPVQTKGRFGRLPISAVRIDNSRDWRKQHWRTLAQSYSRSPHFAEHAAFFERIYARRWERLIDLCTEINAYLLRALHIDTPLRQASSLGASGVKDDLVLALCRACGATTYLSGVWDATICASSGSHRQGSRCVFRTMRIRFIPSAGPRSSRISRSWTCCLNAVPPVGTFCEVRRWRRVERKECGDEQ
jgi:hypothetical protein